MRVESYSRRSQVSRNDEPRHGTNHRRTSADSFQQARRQAAANAEARLAEARRRSEAALAAARAAEAQVAALKRATHGHPGLRGEVEEARQNAATQWRAASDAAHAELRTLKLLGTPAASQAREAEFSAVANESSHFKSDFAEATATDQRLDAARARTLTAVSTARQQQADLDAMEHSLESAPPGRRNMMRAELSQLRSTVSSAWAQAGQSANAEVELTRNQLGDEAADSLRQDLRSVTENSTYVGYASGETQTSAIAAQASHAASSVADAYRNGGAAAATKELRAQMEKCTSPEVAAEILKAAGPTLDKVVKDITVQSRDSSTLQEGTRANLEVKAMLGDLNAAARFASHAGSPLGDEAVQSLSKKLCGVFDDKDGSHPSYAFDTLQRLMAGAIGSGDSAVLAAGMAREFERTGHHDVATSMSMVVEVGAQTLKGNFDSAKEKYDAKQKELEWLIGTYGPLMSKAELQGAIEAFQKENHEVYDNYSKLGGALVGTLDVLHRTGHEIPGMEGDLNGALSELAERLPDALGTSGGSAELSLSAEGQLNGEPSFLDDLDSIASKVRDSKGWLKTVGSSVVEGVTAGAQRLIAGGKPEMAELLISKLSEHAALFGVDAAQMNRVQERLSAVFAPGLTLEERVAAQRAFCAELDGINSLSANTRLGKSFRAAGAVLGTVGAAASVQAAFNDPSVDTVANALFDTAGAGLSGSQFVAALKGNTALLEGGLATAEKALGVLGGVLQGAEAVVAFTQGDVAGGTISGIGAVGSILMAAGATGPGIIVTGAAVVAGLAYGQYQKVQMSNAHENDSSRAFLEGAGISKGVADHLVDCDDEGRAPGPTLVALAERMHIPKNEMLHFLNGLSGDQVLDIVHACHGVDYSVKDGKLNFPMHAANDFVFGIGRTPPNARGYIPQGPGSLPALQVWLERYAKEHHLDLPS